MTAHAQLVVRVSQPKIAGQKAVVPLDIKNEFSQKIKSARASIFLRDEKGKIVAQSTKWIIGGIENKPGLAPGATNAFFFVVTADKRLPATNLTATVNFIRVVLEGGKLANPTRDVRVEPQR